MKFEFNWPSGFRGEDVENVDGRTTNGRRSHWYTNSSPAAFGSGELNRADGEL